MINVYDLKQYIYCPRIIYWYYCSPIKFHQSYKMEWGAEQHKDEQRKEIRRSLERYELSEAVQHFEYPIDNNILTGKLDLLLISGNTYVPVEYKFTRTSNVFSHKIQLYGYALLLEEVFKTKVKFGFLYYPRLKELEKITINASHFDKVRDIIKSVEKIVEDVYLPDVEVSENKCYSCEFYLFCNDCV